MIPAVIERCAGIDVGRKFIDVCLMIGEAQAEPKQETRRFNTLNEDLERMRQWLKENQVYARGHGEHRIVLAADLQHSG
jgi:hypothetical protein